MQAAWKPHMLFVRYSSRASRFPGALCAKATMPQALLAHHSFTLAYAPKLSLFFSLLGVYQRQVRAIGGEIAPCVSVPSVVQHVSLPQWYTACEHMNSGLRDPWMR